MTHIGRIKVVRVQGVCEFDWLVKCPHCGAEVLYGDMKTTSGIHNCYHCNDEVNKQIELDKKTNYDVYVRKANHNEYEPYRYVEVEE